jgi:mannose-6-phosphate isomerase-like protein (cupin superfamily)
MREATTATPSGVMTDHRSARTRRVVTGLTPDGRSTIVSDELSEQRVVGDAYAVNMVWQVTALPMTVTSENAITEINFRPTEAGLTEVTTTFPPDASYDYKAGYEKSLKGWGANHHTDPSDNPAMHTTDSIDIITVVSGELWAILEDKQTLLKAGDTLVQRGTKHAWENRSNRDRTISAVLINAKR